MDSSEQWLNGGNCDICRRKKYCSKPCKRSKGRKQMQIVSAMAGIMYDVLAKAASADPKE